MIIISNKERVRIGENIRSLRKKKGINQKQFSKLTGIPVGTLSKYENGKATPDHDALVKMSVVLNETINMIMMNFNDPDSEKALEPLIKD